MTKDRRKIAEEFAHQLKAKYGDSVEQVILYGSVARGEEHPESDIDILVVTRDTSWSFRISLAAEASEVLMREGVYVSAKPVNVDRFKQPGETLFWRNVRREGLVLA